MLPRALSLLFLNTCGVNQCGRAGEVIDPVKFAVPPYLRERLGGREAGTGVLWGWLGHAGSQAKLTNGNPSEL